MTPPVQFMAIFVLSVGGSTIVPNGEVNVYFLKALTTLLKRRALKGDRFVVIVGGGGTCRKYQQGLKAAAKATNNDLDWIGVYATHLNAHLVRLALGKFAHPTIVIYHRDFDLRSWKKPIVVGGGHKPGGSTDTNMIFFAKKLGAKDVINLSNVDFLYTKDPNKYENAEKIVSISWKEYRHMIGGKWRPGMNVVFDPIAARLAQEARIRVALLGADIKNLDRYLSAKPFKGSVIS